MILTSRSEVLAVLWQCEAVKLLDENNKFASRLTHREAEVMAGFGHLEAHMYKGRLIHVRLKRGVSVNTAMRRVTPLGVPVSNRVTKRRQGNGAKRWVPHFEKSEGGLVSTHKRVWHPRVTEAHA